MFSKLGDIQYIKGCSVHGGISLARWGMFSTSGDIIMNMGGYHVYIRGCSVHWRLNTISTLGEGGNIMSTLGDVQHIRGIS